MRFFGAQPSAFISNGFSQENGRLAREAEAAERLVVEKAEADAAEALRLEAEAAAAVKTPRRR